MKVTVAILLTIMITAGSAQAMTVSAKVGPLIRDAQSLIQARHYKAASAKLAEAEAVKSWPDDETVISQVRLYLAVASDPTHPHCIINNGMGISGCDGRAIGAQP